MLIPLTFVGGLFEVYKSTVWTLTYREIHLLGDLETEPLETEPEVAQLSEPETDEDTTEDEDAFLS